MKQKVYDEHNGNVNSAKSDTSNDEVLKSVKIEQLEIDEGGKGNNYFEKTKNVETKPIGVSMGQLLFKYCDGLDKILLVLGTLAALATAGIYPLMFVMYGKVATALIDYSKNASNLTVGAAMNSSSLSASDLQEILKCLKVTNETSTSSSPSDDINSSVTQYLIFGCTSMVTNYLSYLCWTTVAERRIKRLKFLLFRSILKQEISFFDKNSSGDLNSRITSNMDKIKMSIGYKVPNTITMFSRGIACLILAMTAAWEFSLVILCVVPVLGICMAAISILTKRLEERQIKAYARAGSIAQEVLSSLRTILSLNMHKKEIANYVDSLNEAERMSIRKGLVSGVSIGLTTSSLHCTYAVGIVYATHLNLKDCLGSPAGSIMQAFFCMLTASFSIGDAAPFFASLAESQAAAKSVYDIIEKESEIDSTKDDGLILGTFNGNIKFKDVFFSYPQRPDAEILKGFSLKIPAGKTVALCGASGCGKSTTMQLLQRFYEPASGTVKIDGNLIEDLNIKWLRNQMALVSQEPILFATTIRENIRLGRLDATDAEIEEASKQANAHKFIMQLKDRYDTMVGERGSQLSGGQKQRISIARALVRNPRILLLDEATSALDLESEKQVQEALDRAKIGRTTIIIAHRLSTIRNADIIVGVHNGRVVEYGSHDELIELKGIYYDLNTKQTKEVQKPLDFEEAELRRRKKSVRQVDPDEDEDETEESEEKGERKQTLQRQQSKTSSIIADLPKELKKLFKYERLLLPYHKPDIVWILLGSVGQLVSGAAFPVITIVFLEVYNIFISAPSTRIAQSLEIMGIILGISAVSFIAINANRYGFGYATAKLIKRVRAQLFESMIRQEIGWHDDDENRSGRLCTVLESSVPLCNGLTIDWLNVVISGIAGFGVSLGVSFYLSWKLAFAMLGFVPINVFCGFFMQRSNVSQRSNKTNDASAIESSGVLTIECVESIRTIVSLGRENFFIKKFENIFEKDFRKVLAFLHLQAFFYALSNSLLFFIQATTFSIGFVLMQTDKLAIQNLYRIYASMTFSSMILGRVFSEVPDKKRVDDAAKQIFKIIQRKSRIDPFNEDGLVLGMFNGDIVLDDVHFRYPTRYNKILNGLNLTIAPNQTTALVGQSGCGKSTVIQLLLRFYDVDKGRVLIDGHDIKELNINWLRSQIGLVAQEPILFNTTIKDNIEYGDVLRNEVGISEVIDVAKQANIHPRIDNLPDKYNTIVGNKGGQLSGGEKQRVAIARALLRKPKLLLLDEATSALDQESEELVQTALDKAQHGRTCVCIAHRLSTIQNAAKISVFKDGQILEEGSHAQLMQNKKLYFTLQTQNLANR